MEYAVLSLLAGVPVAMLLVFRSNAALAFLAICGSIALLQYSVPAFTDDLDFNGSALAFTNTLSVLILVLPWLLTTLFTVKTMKKAKTLLNIVPALACGVAFAYLASRYLPGSGPLKVSAENAVLTQLENSWPYVLTGGVAFSLFMLWLNRPKKDDKKH